jgi:murein DD-endopeptidase MepM/ murein hydrolase activator NlpD
VRITPKAAQAAALPASVLLVLALSGCRPGTVDAAPEPSLTADSPSAGAPRPGSTTPELTSSVTATAKPSASVLRPDYTFPVRSSKVSFGRGHHDYPATDIFAPCGSSVVAPVSGKVSEVSRTDVWSSRKNDGATRGGLSFSIIGMDGVRYYGSHLRMIATPIVPGHQVKVGDLIGEVGNTGDARGLSCHVHFGISPACGTGDWWTRRGVLAPYPFLKSWQAAHNRSPTAAVTAWRTAHGCPKTPTTDP